MMHGQRNIKLVEWFHVLKYKVVASVLQMCYKLKPFHGARVCLFGFPDDERQHMIEVLEENSGTATDLKDPACTLVVSCVYKGGELDHC
jgi:hypothetical protein